MPQAGKGTRTPDLLLTRQLLYQLSYPGAKPRLAMRSNHRGSAHALWNTCAMNPERVISTDALTQVVRLPLRRRGRLALGRARRGVRAARSQRRGQVDSDPPAARDAQAYFRLVLRSRATTAWRDRVRAHRAHRRAAERLRLRGRVDRSPGPEALLAPARRRRRPTRPTRLQSGFAQTSTGRRRSCHAEIIRRSA